MGASGIFFGEISKNPSPPARVGTADLRRTAKKSIHGGAEFVAAKNHFWPPPPVGQNQKRQNQNGTASRRFAAEIYFFRQ